MLESVCEQSRLEAAAAKQCKGPEGRGDPATHRSGLYAEYVTGTSTENAAQNRDATDPTSHRRTKNGTKKS